jgi:predicted AlkP superfamily pyrophosphatase or phosphodiesterase
MLLLVLSLSLGAQPRTPKAVFIIADGIPADVIDSMDLPNLKAIARAGGYTHTLVGGQPGTHTQTPTISAVGYNTVLTGVWVHKHNVWDNDIKAINYHYPNVFRLLKEQRPQSEIAIFSTWQDNRTKLVGEGLPQAGNVRFNYSLDGLELDTLHYPHDAAKYYIHQIDEEVSDTAAAVIASNGPQLTWVYLEYTDDMGHRYGTRHEKFIESVKMADAQVGKIWQAVQKRQQQHNEDWLVIVTTDHGRDSLTGKNHGGQSRREKDGWIVTNAQGLNERFRRNESQLTDIMPTLLRHLQVQAPATVLREVDGMPFTGNISLGHVQAGIADGKLTLHWKAYNPKGKASIWYAPITASYPSEWPAYKMLKKVRVKKQQLMVPWPADPKQPYMFMIEGRYNSANSWWWPRDASLAWPKQ